MRVDVWSDMICPFCYIGKKRLENVAAEAGVPLEVRWHSYELDPNSPRVLPGTLAERIAKKYGLTVADAMERQITLAETAATEGIDFQWEAARPGNTFDAHRLSHLATERGLGSAFEERVFHAYMTEGQAVGEREVLLRLAVEAGLDESEARATLDSDRFAQDVRADQNFAQTELGVRGVPFFVFEGRIGLSGAQPRELFREALKQAAAAQAANSEAPQG
ncbi:MAG: DsbA family oxidoreductase [Rhizobiales bacterium]|nr:DsbA family oxidoreductase [Hyphomicrobiales bacterium]